jgi:hypothetical protein
MNIADEFKNFPRMALKCSLYGIEPLLESRSRTVEITDFMHEVLKDTVEAKFLGNQDDCHYVDLAISDAIDGFTSVKEILVHKKYAKTADLSKSPYRIKTQPIKKSIRENGEEKGIRNELTKKPSNGEVKAPQFKTYSKIELNLTKGDKCDLIVCGIETVFEFYVQAVSCKNSSSDFSKLMSEIQCFYERKTNLSQPLFEVNNACAYYDSEQKTWYRAQIENIIDKDHCVVSLVDFGSKRYVNRTYLRDIPEKFIELQCQSALAALYDIVHEQLEVVDEQLHIRFKEIALQKSFYCKVMGVSDVASSSNQNCNNKVKHKYLLNLFDENSESVYSLLVDNVNTSILVPSDKFKPKKISSLDETRLNGQSFLESENSILNTTATENRQLRGYPDSSAKNQSHINNNNNNNKGERRFFPEASVHDDPTSPFPLHAELTNKLKPRKNSNETELKLPTSKGQDQVDHIIMRNGTGNCYFSF